jgi:hypothetical protein
MVYYVLRTDEFDLFIHPFIVEVECSKCNLIGAYVAYIHPYEIQTLYWLILHTKSDRGIQNIISL